MLYERIIVELNYEMSKPVHALTKKNRDDTGLGCAVSVISGFIYGTNTSPTTLIQVSSRPYNPNKCVCYCAMRMPKSCPMF